MCTIMTSTVEKFTEHETAFLGRIRADARTNDDGYSLLLVGEDQSKTQLSRSMDVESIIDILKVKRFKRFFLHSRMATTQYKGIDGCHGFIGAHDNKEWFVFHNGVFRHPHAAKHKVDSGWLASLVTQFGPTAALSVISNNESYANILLVSPQAELFHAMHQTSGTLYKDDAGSYSTNKMDGVIELPVKDREWLYHKMPCPKIHKSYSGYTGAWRGKQEETTLPPALTTTTEEPTGEWKQISGIWRKKINDVTMVALRKPKAG